MKGKYEMIVIGAYMSNFRFAQIKATQSAIYEDEISDFLFQTCMSKIRNTGLGYTYLKMYLSQSRIQNHIKFSSLWLMW